MRTGRPIAWVADEWRERILEEIGEGALLVELCGREGWPSRSTVSRWLRDDPDFWAAYRLRAREQGADAIAERALIDARNAKDAALGTLAWRAATWHVAKMNPDRYGERVNLQRQEKPISEMTDDELASIAAGGRGRAAGEAEG